MASACHVDVQCLMIIKAAIAVSDNLYGTATPLNRPRNRARIWHVARIELSDAATYLAQGRRSPAPLV